MATTAVDARNEAGELIRPDSDAWRSWTQVEDVLEHRPQRVALLIEALDTDRPAMRHVKTLWDRGDRVAACEALLAYFDEDAEGGWILDLLPEPNDRHVELADEVLAGKARKGNRVGEVPTQHGAWDWNYTGPVDNREFAFKLNRHAFFVHLLLAYQKTGDERYAAAFDRLIRDWVLHTVYPGEKHQYVWTWRVLEVGLRMRPWPPAFHGFLKSDAFTPAGRLLMLSSFVQHGRYLKMHHWEKHNHALMEHDGLNRLGLALPELREAEGWHRYAVREMLEEMEHQVYPDGAHDELSSGYHWVSLNSYEQIVEVCDAAGREVPEAYRDRLVEMYDYWVGLVRPTGTLPQNNRSDRSDPTGRVLRAAERYDRPDWRHMVTQGEQGQPPEGLASRMAPWAGHLVSRDGWGPRAMWSFFDMGPAGAGWVHPDALHLSVTAFGKDFLVDAGRFWYMRDQWTDFAHSSRSHNVILIDGRDQQPQPKKARRPHPEADWAITPAFDFGRATHDRFEKLEGKAAHTRVVTLIKGVGWIVIDRITTDRPRELTALWRFRPERTVKPADAGAIVTADDAGANLSITPLGDMPWSVDLIRGQKQPHLQGWHSDRTTEWEPATCASLTGKIEGDAVFGWVILPVETGEAVPARDATWLVRDDAAIVQFDDATGRSHHYRIPLDTGQPTRIGR